MNVLFLSPHFPPNYANFCRALRDEGATVLGIGDAPAHDVHPAVRDVLAEYAYVPQMEHYDSLLRAAAWLVSRFGRIERIDSQNEHWMELEAQLREDFNVPGQKPADTAVNRRKMGMKGVFRAAGIPCAAGERADDPARVRAFAKRHGYPLVIKPDVGVGAARTWRIENEAQLEAALFGLPKGYIVEEWLTGRLVSFDGLADRDGEIVFCTSHEFSSGILEVVNDGAPLHSVTVRDIPADLEALGRRVVAAFAVRERFFHIEFFRSPDGTHRAVEINVRPPGGHCPDLINYSFDNDIYRAWARLLVQGGLDGWSYERRYNVGNVSRWDGRRYRYDERTLQQRYGSIIIDKGRMPPAFAKAMGDAYVVFRHPDRALVDEAIRVAEEPA
jgi:hypothetical protein